MTTHRILLGVTALFLTTGAALASMDDTAPTPEATATVAYPSDPGAVSLPADRHRRLYAEFLFSQRLTAELRLALRRAGYSVADDKASAEVIYEMDGAYQALRPATGRTAEIRAGDFAERPDALRTKTSASAVVLVSLDPLALLLGTILSTVGELTGLRDATNEAVSRDPDGACLARCDGWEYRQRAVVRVKRVEGGATASASATSTAHAPKLEAATLLSQAAGELSRVIGLPPIAFTLGPTP